MATRTRPAACCAPVQVTALSDKQVSRMTKLAKSLADPNRIRILHLLAQQPGPVCACDIVGHVELSQPTVSHHLKTLRDAGLLDSCRQGLWVFYNVNSTGERAMQELTALLD